MELVFQGARVEQQGRLTDLDLARRAAARPVRHHHLASAQHMQEATSLSGVEVRDATQGAGMEKVRMHPKTFEQA
jgi:hypothetical protein